MNLTVHSAIATFGATAKEKLSNAAASGQPEDQLRAPFERLLADLAELSRLPKSAVAAVGESSISDLKTRPDYAVTVHNALVGFVELKAESTRQRRRSAQVQRSARQGPVGETTLPAQPRLHGRQCI